MRIFELGVELGNGRILATDFRSERQSRIDLPGAGRLQLGGEQIDLGDGVLQVELARRAGLGELFDIVPPLSGIIQLGLQPLDVGDREIDLRLELLDLLARLRDRRRELLDLAS